MKKTALAICLLLTITLGLFLSLNLVDIAEVSAQVDDGNNAVTRISPENTTYPTANVELEVSRKDHYSMWWYSLDEGEWEDLSERKTTLENLSEGAHNLIVRALDRQDGYVFSSLVFSVDARAHEFNLSTTVC
jgi:hypothetical protein